MNIQYYQDGTFIPGDIYRAIVTNKAKLIYEEVGDWLEGKIPEPPSVSQVPGLKEQLLLQADTMKRLKKNRREQGALELNTIEAEAVVEEGLVRDLVIQRQNMARCLIEEFMVAANGTMVSYLGDAGIPMIQRVVRIPKNWEGIVMVAAMYHEKLPANRMPKRLRNFSSAKKLLILNASLTCH